MVLATVAHYLTDQAAIDSCLDDGGSFHYSSDFCSQKESYQGSKNFVANHKPLIIALSVSLLLALASVFIGDPKANNKTKGQRKRLLMIDNYDSFTFNLVQYFGELGVEVIVKRNDEISIAEIETLKPDYIVISPGPCTPNESGVSLQVIEQLAGKYPILGVCLGHQAMAQVFGGDVIRAEQVMHGKTSPIYHHGKGMFKDLPNPFNATRYHSLVVKSSTLPYEFEVTAWTQNQEGELEYIMGIKHKSLPLEGMQFHPESILSEHGHQILENFLKG
ncbi:MAG: aminodeoxychorismate/anthranilate synthase component II [Kangiellaceae bacterium]|nr:aminodeoxychorismate/anthranilate synthase component II [Kangiellaceae bacterium]